MATQLVPLAIIRKATDGNARLVAEPLTDKRPPAQTLMIQVGPAFTSKSMLAQTLRDLAMAIESASLDMEPAP